MAAISRSWFLGPKLSIILIQLLPLISGLTLPVDVCTPGSACTTNATSANTSTSLTAMRPAPSVFIISHTDFRIVFRNNGGAILDIWEPGLHVRFGGAKVEYWGVYVADLLSHADGWRSGVGTYIWVLRGRYGIRGTEGRSEKNAGDRFSSSKECGELRQDARGKESRHE